MRLRLLVVLLFGFVESCLGQLSVFPDMVALLEGKLSDLDCNLPKSAGVFEMLSPPLARNGRLTLLLRVEVDKGGSFVVDAGLNPVKSLRLTAWRYYPGHILPVNSITPRIEEVELPHRGRVGLNDRCALVFLDVEVPGDLAPQRVKLEPAAWMPNAAGEGTWHRYPMELRVEEKKLPRGAEDLRFCPQEPQQILETNLWAFGEQCRPAPLACELGSLGEENHTLGALLARNLLQDRDYLPSQWPACGAPGRIEGRVDQYLRVRNLLPRFTASPGARLLQ
jgi:hypothetical protein